MIVLIKFLVLSSSVNGKVKLWILYNFHLVLFQLQGYLWNFKCTKLVVHKLNETTLYCLLAKGLSNEGNGSTVRESNN